MDKYLQSIENLKKTHDKELADHVREQNEKYNILLK